MRASSSEFTEQWGVNLAQAGALDMEWIFRPQTTSDYGIDAHVELVENGLVMGRLIALQIKGGPSYFREWSESEQRWTFRSDLDHLSYWLGHVLPVVVVIADPETKKAYWQVVAEHTVRETEKGFALSIPLDQPFGASACDELRRIAARDDQRVLADFAHNLELLPPGAEDALRIAHQSDPVAAATVADLLAQGRVEPALTAEAIVGAQPGTVTNSALSALLWTAIAEYGLAHNARRSGGEAFLLAANTGGPEGPRRRAFGGILLGSVGEVDRARVELERARDEGAMLVASVGLTMLDVPPNSAQPIPIPEVVARASTQEIEGDAFLTVFLAEQHERRHESAEAQLLLELAVERSPRAHGIKLALAQLLGRQIGLVGTGGGFELRRARQLLGDAIKEMRRWDGPSEEPLRMLIHLRLGQGETTQALEDASPPPFGTAKPREASDPEIAASGALAAVHLGRTEDRDRFLAALGDHPRRLMVEAWIPTLEHNDPAAASAWQRALDAVADDDVARAQCLSQLARLGVWSEATANDLRSRGVMDDLTFQILEATSISRSNLDEAVGRLRGLSRTSHLAGVALVQAYEEAGRRDDALEECHTQMQQWPEKQFPILLADLLRQTGRDDEARSLIESLLGRTDLSDDLRHSFRRWLIHYYGGAECNWIRVAEIAKSALEDRPNDADVGWNYLIALSNQRKAPEARAALRALSLMPEALDEVRLWIQLHLGEQWSEGDVGRAIDIAERFADERQLAVMLVSLAAREIALGETTYGEDVRDRVGEASGKIGVDPTVVRSFAENPEQLDEVVRDRLMHDSQEVGRLLVSVRNGELPLGRLAARQRIPYAQALVQRVAGVIFANRAVSLEEEIDVAVAARDARWVVDSSSLHVSSLLGDVGVRLRGMARQLVAVEAAADDALRGRDAVRIETSSRLSMRFDPITGGFRREDLTPERVAAFRRQASELERLVQQCTLYRVAATLPNVLPYDDAWAAPVELAKAQGLVLYSDDVALRRIASAQGVRSFGTYALLLAVSRTGVLASDLSSERLALVVGFVVDTPVSASELVDLARQEDWASGSASEVVGRQAWWEQNMVEDWLIVADAMPTSALVHWTQLAVAGAVAATPRRDEQADAAFNVVAVSLAAAYMHGERELEFSIRELVEGSSLYDVADRRLRLMEKVAARLDGHVADAVGAASALVVGDSVHLLQAPVVDPPPEVLTD
jgi:tetratricopeptide (TPR) repeat protein